ncbi:hypothetical protein GQ600_14963 [Phytophthora cactorum]|nr:hypothetical protein GQ600_14963 [Phytophthora cactorum]
MCYQTQMEDDFISRVFKLGVVNHTDYDQEMTHVANLVSEHACNLIYQQYQFAKCRACDNFYEAIPGISSLRMTSTKKIIWTSLVLSTP